MLYIFWFLHQTTTCSRERFVSACCISFDSYIKPQPSPFPIFIETVVYLLIPTSNHNTKNNEIVYVALYIFWFLHQTTTYTSYGLKSRCCISFDSYIKPQRGVGGCICAFGCISFDSYIKPQLVEYFFYLSSCCISFDSYIKPQHAPHHYPLFLVVYLLIPTSNHNLFCVWT